MALRLINVCTVAALGLLLSGIAWSGRKPMPVRPSPYDKAIIALDRQAVNEAYRAQIIALFQVWMRDEHGQPGRALRGVQQARRAYIEAMQEITRRESDDPGR